VAAIEASDLTLVLGDLLSVPDAIALPWGTLTTIKGNLARALGYNAMAIHLTAGLLSPMIAVAAIVFSSLFVVSNSVRVHRFQPADLAGS
jgi:Cu+-exporting ATPase